MNNGITLSLGQQFDIEKTHRDIDALNDCDSLRALTKHLLLKWQQEKATCKHLMAKQLGHWQS